MNIHACFPQVVLGGNLNPDDKFAPGTPAIFKCRDCDNELTLTPVQWFAWLKSFVFGIK